MRGSAEHDGYGAARQGRWGVKVILVILLLSALALLLDLPIAGLGLVLVASVLTIGDLVQAMPESACTHNCNQGDNCTCQLANQEQKQ